MNKEILTFQEFIDYCGISKSQGYKLTSGRKLPFYKPNNGKLYFKKQDIDNYLLQNYSDAAPFVESDLVQGL